MNERLMRFGAVMHDGWWIFALACLMGAGIGWMLDRAFAHPVWWQFALALVAGWAVGRLMVALLLRWHDRCVARRWRTILAMRVPLTEAFWQKTRGDDDGDR